MKTFQLETLKDAPTSGKSRTMTLVLCLFLGMLGIHRFYTGKPGTAVVMLLCSVSVVLFWVTAIWVVVDFVSILIGGFRDGTNHVVRTW